VRGRCERAGRAAPWTALLAAAALAASCTDAPPTATPAARDGLVVASFDVDESRLLAEIYALALEDEGIAVRRELDLGPRDVVLPAMRQGFVDVAPEHLGTLLDVAARGPRGDESDPTLLQGLVNAVLRPWGLEALTPSPAVDPSAIVVTQATATQHDLHTISDLGPLATALTLGGPAECPQRERCLLGLDEVYALRFARFLPFDQGRLVRQALLDGVVDVGVLSATDGSLAREDLVVLTDDRGLQPAENLVPVVRSAAIEGTRAAAVLDEVSAALTTSELRFLSWRMSEAGGSRPSTFSSSSSERRRFSG
jgi:osmoprotectant transport system substrate-binding protein